MSRWVEGRDVHCGCGCFRMLVVREADKLKVSLNETEVPKGDSIMLYSPPVEQIPGGIALMAQAHVCG